MRKLFFVVLFVLMAGPATGFAQAAKPQTMADRIPGFIPGYLSKEEIPNSIALLPLPPEAGSVAFALDQDIAKHAVESETKDAARFQQAYVDSILVFPDAVKSFESTLGIEISETKTPRLYVLMRRVLTDAALSVGGAKNKYQRARPFMINNTPTCTPKEEEGLRKNGSYPSGHTAIGWAWALVFAEIFPAKADAIFLRGYAYGESRVACNVHWHSDVEAGRILGAATVARLHANPTFLEDLAAAKKEVIAPGN